MSRLLSFFLFLFPSCLLAYQPAYVNYTIADGLPSNTVFCSMQDSKGYLWFGTDKGVARFDGTKFTVFSSSDGMADNIVFDIYEDSKKRIWFSCNNGNACYYYHNKFWNKNNDTILHKLTANSLGLKVLEDRWRNVYILTQFQLFQLDSLNHIIELKNPTVNAYSSMVLNDSKEVIVLTNKGIYNTHSGRFKLITKSEEIKPMLYSKAIFTNHQLFYNQGSSVAFFNTEETNPNQYDIPIMEAPTITQCLKIDDNGNLLIGTQQALVTYSFNEKKIINQSFKGFSISSFTQDFEGNFWMTSLNKGVLLRVNEHIKLLNEHAGLTFNFVGFIDKLKDGTIALGSNQYKASFIKNGIIHNLQLPKEAGEGRIEKIIEGINNCFYLTAGAVTIKVDKRTWKATVIKMSARDINIISGEQTIIVVSNAVLTLKTDDFEEAYSKKNYLHDTTVGFIFQNVKASGVYHKKGSENIYIYGLFGVKKMVDHTLVPILNQHEFVAKNITSVAETKEGIPCFSSNIYGVLVVYKNKIYSINKSNGLGTNFVNSIYLDQDDNLWAATSEGLSKIELHFLPNTCQFNIKNYSLKDGLNARSINDIAMDGDTIYAATDNGVNIFTENQMFHHAIKPKLNIESIYIHDSLHPFSTHYNTSYKKNYIRINFIGISYTSFGNLHYLYRLKGVDEDWKITKNNVLEYASLPNGNFEFELIAINQNQVQSDKVSFKVYVAPPFWKTWWFVFGSLLGLGLLIFYLIRLRINTIQKNHQTREQLLHLKNLNFEAEKKQAIYEKEIMDIQNQALRLHMNPHFIFNSINSIQGFYASGEISMAKKYIGKFSTLLRMILDQSKKDLIDINDEVTTIEYYLELNQLRFENKFEFEVKTDKSLLQNREEIPPMIIQPFIENAIIHGMAPLKKMGKITVRLIDDGSYIRCEIEDNGVGREYSRMLQKNKNYESTGIRVTEKRIDMHNKTASNPQVPGLTIIDLHDLEGNISGTLVQFSLLKHTD